MFSKKLRFAGHVKCFLINSLGRERLEVREEQGQQVVKQVRYSDWHRVEHMLNLFNMEIGELESQGWVAAA